MEVLSLLLSFSTRRKDSTRQPLENSSERGEKKEGVDTGGEEIMRIPVGEMKTTKNKQG